MPRYVALLRAVNLGGNTTRRSVDLRTAVEGDPIRDVRTVLQSGNLVFDAPARAAGELEREIERRLAARFARPTVVFVRTAAEWLELLAGNPYRAEAARDPAHLLLTVTKREPPAAAWPRLRAVIVGRERFTPGPRCAYLVYPDGIGTSKLTPARIELALGAPVTARNWNTVGRLAALLED